MFEKWKRKLKEKLHRVNQDDRGSSFVVVIIGIMALTIVGATILSVATNYVITVIVDQNVTDNFYETEGVMGEIRSGLEEICGAANEYAYMEVINHYNAASDPSDGKLSSKMETMKDKYAVKYLTGIVSMLNKPTIISSMDDSKNEFDNIISGWDGTNQEKEDWQSFPVATFDKVKEMVTRPATVGSTYAGNQLKYGFCIKREDDDPDGKIEEMYLVISGLKVDYKDQDGYRSVVQTDIRIDVPDYGFEGNATLDEMRKYIVICDRRLSVSTVSLGGSALGIDFDGSVYAGGDFDSSHNYETGIEIKPNAQNVTFKSDTLISRGNLLVGDKASINVNKQDGEFWIKNVVLSGNSPAESPAPGSTTKLKLNTNSYVLDDLSIDNNNCEVDLGGKYYGYSYNETNENTGSDSTVANYSSAILVNGKNTTLLSDSLRKLILAGRTFVSRDMRTGTEPDISMGESLAVKSNQIAYLVPDSCIKAEHNPLTSEEATLASGDWRLAVDQTKLEQTIAWPYLDSSEPVTFNYANEDPGYAFLYLNFKNQKAANDYFSKYYDEEENEAMLRDRAETYISTSDNEGMKLGAHLYLIAGNIIHNYYSVTGKSVKQDANYFDGSGAPNEGMLLDGRKKMQNYLGKQLTLVNSGYKTGMRTRYELLTGAQKKELVRDEIVDFDAINADAGIMNIQKNNTDTAVGGTLFITPGDYTVDGSITRGLIISGGTVTVNRDFEGLILAKDKVIVSGSNINLVSNASLVGSLMDMVEKDPELAKYFHKLKKEEKDDTSVADCISYENWKRDSEDQL